MIHFPRSHTHTQKQYFPRSHPKSDTLSKISPREWRHCPWVAFRTGGGLRTPHTPLSCWDPGSHNTPTAENTHWAQTEIRIDWLIDWLVDWLVAWLIGWLIGWLIDWLIGWLIDWLIDWLTDWLIDCLIALRPANHNDYLRTDWLVTSLV